MKVTLLVVGKTTDIFALGALTEYQKRLKHYIPFSIEVIPEIKAAKNLSEEQIKAKEAELILSFIKPGDCMVLLDERGQEFTSEGFSGFLQKKMNSGIKNLLFVIGGPYGFDQTVYKASNESVSMSKMTFSHQMIRVIFLEQLYRAMTILSGEPYHHP
jgi:23S rRNA (pseudouridine1915-N3)-methyltransferase